MNIFYVDADPREAAISLVDKHVVKMILESAQLLCTAHRVLDGEQYTKLSKTGRKMKSWKLKGKQDEVLYHATHVNHPSAIWVRESVANYVWLWNHLRCLCNEYTHRYGKYHKIDLSGLLFELYTPPLNIPKTDSTPIPLAMPEEYKIGNPIESYREYYKKAKKDLHKWTKRNPPKWIE